jgi:hypothetical protein
VAILQRRAPRAADARVDVRHVLRGGRRSRWCGRERAHRLRRG